MSQKQSQGITLIELTIGLAILGTLVFIAYPSYLQFLLKSRRSDALTALMQSQISLERCYMQNFAYNHCDAMPNFPQTSQLGFYSITLSQFDASSYTLTATPIGSQAKDTTCASMTVNQANVKTAFDLSGTPQTICWH